LILGIALAATISCKALTAPELARGCKAIEFDVRVAADGVLMISHEPVDVPSTEAKGLLTFEAFVAGLKGLSFELVDFDVKDRYYSNSDGMLSKALERHLPALQSLAAQTDALVFSTPVPPRYAELERFVKRTGLKASPSFEISDYTAADADRWGLPLPFMQRMLLPFGRALNRAYRRQRGKDIRYVVMQESTAAKMGDQETATVICWTRDPVAGQPPPACRFSERAK
jgi:hypothetical protein